MGITSKGDHVHLFHPQKGFRFHQGATFYKQPCAWVGCYDWSEVKETDGLSDWLA